VESRLRAGVIGVGYLGRYHAEKYVALEEADLVGVSDLRPDAGQAVAEACATRYFDDYRALAGEVDAVTIATDTATHFEIAKFFLEHGVHVLVEKPMTRTSTEGALLTALAAEKGLKLQVGHIERFNPALLSARGELHSVRFIECHRLAPFKPRSVDVHVVLDLMIHDLDVILSLVDARPVKVSAVGIAVLTGSPDIANARIEFDNGAIANVTASRVSTNAQRKFRVFQEHQYLSIDFGKGEVQRVISRGDWRGDVPPLDIKSWSLQKGDALLAETAAFVRSIREDRPCEVTGEDGVLALELAEEIIADIERRKI
jgi:predicted dehydrogenase